MTPRRPTRRQALRYAGGAAAAGVLATFAGDAAVSGMPVVPPGTTVVDPPTGGDDGPLIQAVHDEIAASGGGVMTFPQGKTYQLQTGIVIDPVQVGVRGAHTTLNASGMGGGAAVTFGGSQKEPGVYATPARGFFDDIELVGPGAGSSVVGIETTGSPEGYTAGMAFSGTAVHGFGTGIQVASYSYINDFFNVAVYACSRGLADQSSAVDAGERITFVGSAIFNCDTGVHLSLPAADYVFVACSFDYNVALGQISDGVRTTLLGCHVEMPTDYADQHLRLLRSGISATTFVMVGGFWAQTGGGTASGAPVVTPLDDQGSLVAFYGVAFEGVVVEGGSFVAGGGTTTVLNPAPDAASARTDFGPVLLSRGQSVVAGGVLDPSATSGFLYVPAVDGTPTGRPAPQQGAVPLVFDTGSDRLFAYHQGWKPV